MGGEKSISEKVTYCGLFCGACPSYQKGTCLGCRSENINQNRKSKWACKIRICCHEQKQLEHCGQCDINPCNLLYKRLINSHLDDLKFNYRHQIPTNLKRLNEIGTEDWSKEQEELWICPICGTQLMFYNYKCRKCGKITDPQATVSK
ncbi:MAG: DUF3795 domain-containing protein [Candidatus Hermodarchaeota archaeon]